MMSYSTRTPVHSRTAQALVQLALLAALGGCGLVPKQPIVQQPMTAQPPMPPQAQSPGSIFNPGYAGRPLFEDQRPRNVGDILTIVIQENVNATKSSGASANRNGTTSFSATGPTHVLPGLFSRLNGSGNGTNTFQGTGGANASNTFNGTIT